MKTPLQEAVEATGLTDQQVAREIGVSVPTVRRWRTGENAPLAGMIPGVLKDLLKMRADKKISPDEAHFVDEKGQVVAKIVNLGKNDGD